MKTYFSIAVAAALLAFAACGSPSGTKVLNERHTDSNLSAGGTAFLKAATGETIAIRFASVSQTNQTAIDTAYFAERLHFVVRGSCALSPRGALELHIWNKFDGTHGEVRKVRLDASQDSESTCSYNGGMKNMLIGLKREGQDLSTFTQMVSVYKLGLKVDDPTAWLDDPVSASHDFQVRLMDAQDAPLEAVKSRIQRQEYVCEGGNLVVGTGAGNYVVEIKGTKVEPAWHAIREYNAFGKTVGVGGKVSVTERVWPEPALYKVNDATTLSIAFSSSSNENGRSYFSTGALADPSSSLTIVDGKAKLVLRGLRHISGAKFESVGIFSREFWDCHSAR